MRCSGKETESDGAGSTVSETLRESPGPEPFERLASSEAAARTRRQRRIRPTGRGWFEDHHEDHHSVPARELPTTWGPGQHQRRSLVRRRRGPVSGVLLRPRQPGAASRSRRQPVVDDGISGGGLEEDRRSLMDRRGGSVRRGRANGEAEPGEHSRLRAVGRSRISTKASRTGSSLPRFSHFISLKRPHPTPPHPTPPEADVRRRSGGGVLKSASCIALLPCHGRSRVKTEIDLSQKARESHVV